MIMNVDMLQERDDGNIKNINKRLKKGKKIRASPVKIAYYVQRMIEKRVSRKEILLILHSQFDRNDLRKFAESYRCCTYIEDIRYIANLIYEVPRKNMDEATDTFTQKGY